ncbi:hypothetical protein [Butyrivibrio sp. VCD2006]|uniref:hypothetical protein n=1 Tax=Butyrivibrio sp. VCD2006 TaxID=1280664 RepID=UPI001FA72515|nr:hypothetical protein [Butyrivibrio sp. VCD2006]
MTKNYDKEGTKMFDLIWGKRNNADTFGKDPTKDAVHYMRKERLKQIAIYHNRIGEGTCIDDITWNDLDMDDVFFRINNTKSFIGEQVLYHRLHFIDESHLKPSSEDAKIDNTKKDNANLYTQNSNEISNLKKLEKWLIS